MQKPPASAGPCRAAALPDGNFSVIFSVIVSGQLSVVLEIAKQVFEHIGLAGKFL